MQKLLIALCLSLAFAVGNPVQANNFVKELTHALERGLDGNTQFVLHMGNGDAITLSGDDYDSFRFYYRDQVREMPSVIELYAGSGKKKANAMINVADAAYYRLEIEKKGGEWVYTCHFWF